MTESFQQISELRGAVAQLTARQQNYESTVRSASELLRRCELLLRQIDGGAGDELGEALRRFRGAVAQVAPEIAAAPGPELPARAPARQAPGPRQAFPADRTPVGLTERASAAQRRAAGAAAAQVPPPQQRPRSAAQRRAWGGAPPPAPEPLVARPSGPGAPANYSAAQRRAWAAAQTPASPVLSAAQRRASDAPRAPAPAPALSVAQRRAGLAPEQPAPSVRVARQRRIEAEAAASGEHHAAPTVTPEQLAALEAEAAEFLAARAAGGEPAAAPAEPLEPPEGPPAHPPEPEPAAAAAQAPAEPLEPPEGPPEPPPEPEAPAG